MNSKPKCIRINANQDKIGQFIEIVTRSQIAFGRLAQILDLAGNENRLKIIYLLREERNLCVCDLSDILGMTIPAVSQHLRKLRDAQLIEAHKVGQTVFYSLRLESAGVLHALLEQLEAFQSEPVLIA